MRFERAKKQGSPYRLTDACVHRVLYPCDRGEERDPRSDGRETTIWKELDKDARLEERTLGILTWPDPGRFHLILGHLVTCLRPVALTYKNLVTTW